MKKALAISVLYSCNMRYFLSVAILNIFLWVPHLAAVDGSVRGDKVHGHC